MPLMFKSHQAKRLPRKMKKVDRDEIEQNHSTAYDYPAIILENSRKENSLRKLSHTTDIARGHLPLLWLFVLSNSVPLNIQFPEAIQQKQHISPISIHTTGNIQFWGLGAIQSDLTTVSFDEMALWQRYNLQCPGESRQDITIQREFTSEL